MDTPDINKTILAADDSLANRLLLKKIFSSECSVLLAGSGSEALDIMRARPGEIDALLLDLIMPGMSGFDVLQVMVNDPQLSQIPVVVITAASAEDDIIKAMDLGAADVILKPFSPHVALHRVRNILTRVDNNRLAEENRLYTELLRRSELDDKTKLYNKNGFYRHAQELLDKYPKTHFPLVRMDIDKFKVYNEVFGYAAGDELLRSIAQSLPAGEKTVSGRLEADHFAFILPSSRLDAKSIDALQKDFLSSHVKNMRLTCSAGVYRITNPTMGVSTMCDRALLALLTVKNSYNDKVARYEDDMLRGLLAEEQLERDMERGISEGQFAVYFQPQVNYDTGYIIGAEALVRWKHPQRGLIQPGEFIPLFEKNGFITRLDEYVWRRTAEYMRSWLDMDVWDTPVPVSVNISRLDIYDTGICEKIKAIVDEYGVPPELFKLEITESAYMDNPHQLISVVKDLKALGFSVEMDDFGSGYSSLNTLKDVPVDVLKLDTRFLCSGEDDARGGSILSSVIRMAHWLKLPVIAEGVETRTQADYLKSLGCFYMQGYYFGRPMPAEDFEKLLTGCRASDSHRYDSVDLAGIAAFWDPSRQTALLFNSFVGGAAILEYQNGMAEILRANDRFYKELGTAREDYLPLQQDTLARFEGKNRAIYLGMLRQAIATRDEAECELESLPLKPGCDSLWTRNRVRLLAVNGDCYLFYVAVET